jgi:serine/threonine protein kinase
MIDEYVLNELVGEGAYGNVYRVTHKLSRVVRAAKRIEKRKKSIQALEESLILKRLVRLP